MHVKTYEVFVRAIEEGIEIGWRRAHKHMDTPTAEEIKEHIQHEIMNAVCEVFVFDPFEPGE